MVNIYIQGQLLDQYDDEAIELTSSVLDVSDITKITGDFSKTFTIPASPNNNKHFKHWYNASIDDGFDARTKVEGHIDIDGVPFKTGKWRLSEAIFKDGVIDGYVINFFGNLPNIKDTIGDDKLSDLNLVKYDHEWKGNVVQAGLTSGLSQGDIVYTPMASKRYFYNSNALSADSGDLSINIASGSLSTNRGLLWSDLRPSIKAKAIIDAIQYKYGTGVRQIASMEVLTSPSVSGLIKLTLNGDIHNILISSSLSIIDIASSIATEINTNIAGYTASVLGQIVFIKSDEAQEEPLPIFDKYEASGMTVNIAQDVGGAYAYENPISFTNDFFDTSEFSEMFLWLKNDKSDEIGGGSSVIPFNTGLQTYFDFDTNIATYNTSWSNGNKNGYKVIVGINDFAGFENVPYTLKGYVKTTYSDGTISENIIEKVADVGEDGNVNEANFTIGLNSKYNGTATHEVYAEVITNTSFTYNAQAVSWIVTNGVDSGLVSNSVTGASIKSIVKMSELMPEMKVVDFLKGIFDMFKLVVIPQDNGDMYVNALDSFYSQGKRHDISDKVDYNTFKVKRGALYQSIGLKFEEPSTILNKKFKDLSTDKQGYGSNLVNIYETLRPIKLIDGEKVDVKLPFEQVVYERLTDNDSSALTNISTATILDDKLAPVTPKPILHYVSAQKVNANKIRFRTDNNVALNLGGFVFMPLCQLGTGNAIYSLSFEAEVSTWNGIKMDRNLYSIHLEKYYAGVFDIKRRVYEYDALLPTQLVTRLGLNDVMVIEGIDYRINKFKHNLLTGITKLELLNSFDTELGGLVGIPPTFEATKEKSASFFNVPKIESGYQLFVNDIGDGDSWAEAIPYKQGDNLLEIRTLTDNPTTIDRSVEIALKSYDTGLTDIIILTQKG